MASQSHSPGPLTFGPFEVNPQARELRRNAIRIRLSGQPFRILLLLLEHPGEVVTREQLREQLWSDGTFVDFEGGLNAAVNKLRRALNDSAENPRYIETIPSRGYRFIGNVACRDSKPIPPVAESALPESQARSRIRRWLWVGAAVAALVVSLLLARRAHDGPDASPPWRSSQLTTDAGFSGNPALSPDGKLVVYSSDRSPEGHRDLYIKQVAGGEPVRLTSDGASNVTPDFSPDGGKIVFRSNRGGGGIYAISSSGGEARLLARDGWNPKFSPDGSRVAYWVGAPNVFVSVPGTGAVWVVPSTGGPPRRLGANFTDARFPIWSPDGKYLLLIGYTSQVAYDRSALDWWLVPTNGSQPLRTGIYSALVRAGLDAGDVEANPAATYPSPRLPRPGCWLADGNRVIFPTFIGDTVNLWETAIAPGRKVTGVFKRLTSGAGNESDVSCASNGLLAFTNGEDREDVWSLPVDLDRGKPTGPLLRITEGPGSRDHSSLSGTGRYLAFASSQSGRMIIWMRDLATGNDSPVMASSFVQRYPVLTASGSRVAFSSFERDKRMVYAAAPGGTPEKLCEGCLRASDWSRDEKKLLVFGGSPYQINLLDVASHQQFPLLRHPAHNLLYGRFSPDDRWVSFTERIGPNRASIVIAPLDGLEAVPEDAWIRISEEGAEDWANWSPDGKTLYFTSGRDGHTCLWAQRLDAGSHKPLGEAFAVQHLHGRLYYRQSGWSAAGGRIAMVLEEDSGNIWMMSRSAGN